METFNSQFNSFAKNPDLNVFPKALLHVISEVDAWVYPTINDGVYRCGFAKSQKAYEDAFDALFFEPGSRGRNSRKTTILMRKPRDFFRHPSVRHVGEVRRGLRGLFQVQQENDSEGLSEYF